MSLLELSFESKEVSLSVRRFAVHEAMSALFSVSIWARSSDDALDLETIVGRAASFKMDRGVAFALHPLRSWGGVCSHMQLVQAEPTGLSTYYLRIVPRLWILTQRRNHRLFQHMSIPDMVGRVLNEWHIRHTFRIHRPDHPKLELRMQYGESDFDFIGRLLEEAGISYFFKDHDSGDSELVLHDAPQTAEPRAGGPIAHEESPNQSGEREYISSVRLAQEVRPGRVTLRDHDFRRHPTFKLQGHGLAAAAHDVEAALEHYAYVPGGFLVQLEEGAHGAGHGLAGRVAGAIEERAHAAASHAEDKVSGRKAEHIVRSAVGELAGDAAGKVAGKIAGEVVDKIAGGLHLGGVLARLLGDDRGMTRFSEKAGIERAKRHLESARASRRSVTFETNAVDISPGTVLTMGGHSRADLGVEKKLMVTHLSLEGAHDGEWSVGAEAVFAEHPYRPPMKTPKPAIQGLQSAVVVGPAGNEIYTDEHGRVRVQFHWDREGEHDERSSCWMRVSQGWAGTGYGMIAIPRVGHEVLVAFLEGDPDQPVVVGGLYNATAPVPYDLPQHRTRSGWKTSSTPGGGGANELMFEDAKGSELVYVHAERDLDTVVKRNEAVSVGVNRRTSIGAVDESHVGARYNVTMRKGDGGKEEPTHLEMVDKRIRFTTGDASITLDGPNITLEAKGRIFLHSTDDDVEILGGPWVKINCGPVKEGESDTVTMHHITGILRDQDGKPLPDWTVVVKASDGSVQQVQTDGAGKYFALVPPGKCQVSLPGEQRYGRKGVNLDHMDLEHEEFDDHGPVV